MRRGLGERRNYETTSQFVRRGADGGHDLCPDGLESVLIRWLSQRWAESTGRVGAGQRRQFLRHDHHRRGKLLRHGVSDQSRRQLLKPVQLWRCLRWAETNRVGAGQRWQFLRHDRTRRGKHFRPGHLRHGVSDQSHRQLREPVLLWWSSRWAHSIRRVGAGQRRQFLWHDRRRRRRRHGVSDQSHRQLLEPILL